MKMEDFSVSPFVSLQLCLANIKRNMRPWVNSGSVSVSNFILLIHMDTQCFSIIYW